MDKKKIASASIMIAVFGIVSKLMGMLRVMAINWKFGQGVETDAYNASVKITSYAISLIAAAVLTSLVPVLAEIKEKYGIRGKFKFFNNISNMVILLSIVISALVYFTAPFIIKITFPGFEGERFQLAVNLTRMSVPSIISLSLMNLTTAYIHSFNIYGPYAIAGIPYNLIFFVYLFFMPLSIEGLTITTIFAVFSQFLVMAPAMFKTGYEYRPLIQFDDHYVARTLQLVVPIMLGQAVQQINEIVDSNLASGLPNGVISAMDTATKVNEAILSVFITGLTTVIFPLLAEAFEKKNRKKILELMDASVGIIFLITIPATVGIIVLSSDIIELLFQRDAFTAKDTVVTAGAFIFYSLGLTGAGLRLLITKVYYSIHDTKTPMINGSIAVGLNIVLNLILVRFMAHRGLALATSIAVTVSTLLMWAQLKKRIPEMNMKHYLVEFIKITISSLAMGFVVYLVDKTLTALGLSLTKTVVLSVMAGIITYLAMIVITRVEAIAELLTLVKNKMNNRKLEA